MMAAIELVSISELRPGDILLCYKHSKVDPIGKTIIKVTRSKYTHAAICTSPNTAAESLVKGGVTKTKISALVERYHHVAVFRQPDVWRNPNRISKLNCFIDSIIASKSKYNFQGICVFQKKLKDHQLSLHDQLHAFFERRLRPLSPEKKSYFCSELIVDCFVATGIIGPAASIAYKSNLTSPGDLGRDPTFGTFYGYLSLTPDCKIPPDDEFASNGTFNEIFGESAPSRHERDS